MQTLSSPDLTESSASSLSPLSSDETCVRQDQQAKPASPPARHSAQNYLSRLDSVAKRKRLLDNPTGTLLRGRFQLLKTLGSGGMGDVYLACDKVKEEFGQGSSYVALKLLNDFCHAQEGALHALQQEAAKAQALSHPNIVRVYDFDRCGDTAFIAMEYLEGQTLKDLLYEKGRLAPSRAMRIIELAARGLAYAHQQGFIHADIKPANIFLTADGAVKLLDLGIARAINRPADQPSLADKLTAQALTPNYATAETLLGEPVSVRDDIYALACVAYQLMTGRHPYTDHYGMALNALDARERHLKVPSIAGLSPKHMRALRKALRLHARFSFASAGEFIDAIKPAPYGPMLRRLGLILAAAAVCIGALFYWQSVRLPSLHELGAAFPEALPLMESADAALALGDIALAHRYYAQVWTSFRHGEWRVSAQDELMLQRMVRHRMTMLVDKLVAKAAEANIDAAQKYEILTALDSLSRTDLPLSAASLRDAIAKVHIKGTHHAP